MRFGNKKVSLEEELRRAALKIDDTALAKLADALAVDFSKVKEMLLGSAASGWHYPQATLLVKADIGKYQANKRDLQRYLAERASEALGGPLGCRIEAAGQKELHVRFYWRGEGLG